MTAYAAYGVRLESEMRLAALPSPRGGEAATVKVLLDPPSRCAPRQQVADAEFLVYGRPLSLHVNGDLELCWRDLVRFRLSLDDCVIRCASTREADPEHVQEWLLHYALPLLLAGGDRLQFLHGSAVQIGRRAVGFLAPSGGGKSTLAEYFLQRGHAFFTDEKLGVVACEQRFAAVPSTPFYRGGETDARWHEVANFAPAPLPLGVLYLLAPASGEGTPSVLPLAPREAAFELAQRCEFQLPPRVRARLRLPPFRIACFQLCTQLAASIRVCRLVVPRDLGRLAEVYETIVADARETA